LIRHGDAALAFKNTHDEAKARGIFELQLNDIVENNNIPSPSTDKNGIGWLMIAFQWAFHYLHNQIPYEEAIKDIL